MAETRLYIVRHGKTMFNTLGRAQGWCDSPLTAKGRLGIQELARGFKAQGLAFAQALTSDSGRTIETLDLLVTGLGTPDLPHRADPRIREWCFGSLEGIYDEELFLGVLPTALGNGQSLDDLTYPEIAGLLQEVDTASWAEPWEAIRERILAGFGQLARDLDKAGGGNALVVCHGMTISTLLWLLNPDQERVMIDNGSVTLLTYNDGQFEIEAVADLSYRQLGKELSEDDNQ